MTEPDRPDLNGLDEACQALADGQAVVMPNASPMSYVVVATTSSAVNGLKGRPLDQNVGITRHDDADWQTVGSAIDLPPDALARMSALMRRELLSFLVPLRADVPCPDWISPAVRNGHLALFAGRWAPLARVWDQFPRLFGSSANRTGHPPARTAAEAAGIFATEALVVDGDALREDGSTRGATTIVRVASDGELSLYRQAAHAPPPASRRRPSFSGWPRSRWTSTEVLVRARWGTESSAPSSVVVPRPGAPSPPLSLNPPPG